MQVYLDDFTVYGARQVHLCLEHCRPARLSLNPAKCDLGMTSGALLGHIVNNKGIAIDPEKMEAVMKAPTPKNAKALERFLGQIRWHNRMIRHLADLTTPLHAAVHKSLFRWTKTED